MSATRHESMARSARGFFGLKSEVFNFFGIIEAWPHED